MIGLSKGELKVVPHNKCWEQYYGEERKYLLSKFSGLILDIRHVGSTAIPNILAKPIIDIAVLTENYDKAAKFVPNIEAIGYKYRGELGVSRRHYFNKEYPETFHLHIFELNSKHWEEILLFKNYLLDNPTIALEYSNLKTTILKDPNMTRQKYYQQKVLFIKSILKEALL